ncbi:hypothetical protein EBZ39_00290 [bacterium]|nr:hypothetical protein [bacterium]
MSLAAAAATGTEYPNRRGNYANRDLNNRTGYRTGPLNRTPKEAVAARLPTRTLGAAIAGLAGRNGRGGSSNHNTLRLSRSGGGFASKRGAGETGDDKSSKNGLHNQKLLEATQPLTYTRTPEFVSYQKSTFVYSPVRGGPVSQPAPDQPS